MKRRDFLTVLGVGAAFPMRASAQSAARIFRVRLLSPGGPVIENPEMGGALLQAMAGHGYERGKNLLVEARAASGRIAELPRLAAEVVAAKIDVIVTNGFPTALVRRQII